MFNFFKRKKSSQSDATIKPQHVAIIMDGNGRWANAKGLSRVAGHRQGSNSVKSMIKSCIEHEIPYLTIFAFSSENWNRPESEISALMDLLSNALETQTEKLNENGVRLNFVGNLEKFNPKIQDLADKAQRQTQANSKLHFSIAINYGGRWDIAQACRTIAKKVASGELSANHISEQSVSDHLSTRDLPDPDLFIRTSGEYRISNFMLWQAAYSEFYFTDTLWPDFDEQAFTQALLAFSKRDRRYGKADELIENEEEKTSIEATNINSKAQLQEQQKARKHA